MTKILENDQKWLKIAKKWQKFAVTLGLILYVYD